VLWSLILFIWLVITEEDTSSNCVEFTLEVRLSHTKVCPAVPQRRIIITNKRVQNEKKFNEGHWRGLVTKLNPIYWFSSGPGTALSVGRRWNTIWCILVDTQSFRCFTSRNARFISGGDLVNEVLGLAGVRQLKRTHEQSKCYLYKILKILTDIT
jgi:hypothetical protein